MTNGFLRWLGGKSSQVDHIIARLRLGADTPAYVEPFLGGGSVFFALAERNQLPPRVILGDANPRIVACYLAIRDELDDVIAALDQLPWGPEYVENFDTVRAAFNDATQQGALHAARMLWLNRHCFNAVWRENRAGRMNAPVGLDSLGRPKANQRPDTAHLRWCSEALQHAEVRFGDFDVTLGDVPDGASVYADPPYVPRDLTGTDTFVSYTAGGFDALDQWRLVRRLRDLAAAGATVVASNHDLPAVRALYAGFGVETIQARRSISRDGSGRGSVGEVLLYATGSVPGEMPAMPRSIPTALYTTASTGETMSSKSAIIRELHTNVRATPGRPRKIELDRHTVVVGKNGAGKSRIGQSLEIALRKRTEAVASDFMFLLPDGEDRLSVQAEFDAEGPLAGQVALFNLDTKTGKMHHAVPPGVVTEWILPVRQVAEILRNEGEDARQFLLPFIAGRLTREDVQKRIPAEFTHPNLPHCGLLPDSIASLLQGISTASTRAKSEAERETVARLLIAQLREGLEPNPSPHDIQAAQGACEHARKVLEASARHAEHVHTSRQTDLLDGIRGQLTVAEAALEATPQPRPLPPQQAATVDLMRRSIDLAKTAVHHNLPTCPGCGREAAAGVYTDWLATLTAYLGQFRAQLEAFEVATTLRTQAEDTVLNLRRQTTELERLIGSIEAAPGVTVQPVVMSEAREALDTTQNVLTTLLKSQQKWSMLHEAEAVVTEAGRLAAWWMSYHSALGDAVDAIIDAEIDRFRKHVQRYLPPDQQFLLALRGGICKIGLEHEGSTRPGNEDPLVWLAVTVAVLDLLPGGPPTYALLALPSEKVWDGETLTSVMKALSNVPYQILLTSTVMPKRPPKTWKIIDLDKIADVSGVDAVTLPSVGEAK